MTSKQRIGYGECGAQGLSPKEFCPKSSGSVPKRVRLASPKARILISSGSSEEMIEKLFANNPFDGFLGRPYSLAELREALQTAAAKS